MEMQQQPLKLHRRFSAKLRKSKWLKLSVLFVLSVLVSIPLGFVLHFYTGENDLITEIAFMAAGWTIGGFLVGMYDYRKEENERRKRNKAGRS